MWRQRFTGLALVGISMVLLALASTGTTVEEQDGTAVVLLLPLGLYMICTRDYILYDGEPEAQEEPEQDPWAPRSPGAESSRLYPIDTFTTHHHLQKD